MYWNINPNIKVFSNIQNMGDVEYRTADNFGDGWYVNGVVKPLQESLSVINLM
jgi:vitamin B12 transporter